jgi:hypothetical protein
VSAKNNCYPFFKKLGPFGSEFLKIKKNGSTNEVLKLMSQYGKNELGTPSLSNKR